MPTTSRRSSGRCSRSPPRSARSSEPRHAARPSPAGAGLTSRSSSAANGASTLPRVGDSQRLTPEEQLRFARDAFDSGTDFTVAVEEEFAILDPETLALTNRFLELQAAASGTPLEGHLVGELI